MCFLYFIINLKSAKYKNNAFASRTTTFIFYIYYFTLFINQGIRAYPSPYQSRVGLSGTLSTPLSLHFVQTTPPIPYARNEQSSDWSKKHRNKVSNKRDSGWKPVLLRLCTAFQRLSTMD